MQYPWMSYTLCYKYVTSSRLLCLLRDTTRRYCKAGGIWSPCSSTSCLELHTRYLKLSFRTQLLIAGIRPSLRSRGVFQRPKNTVIYIWLILIFLIWLIIFSPLLHLTAARPNTWKRCAHCPSSWFHWTCWWLVDAKHFRGWGVIFLRHIDWEHFRRILQRFTGAIRVKVKFEMLSLLSLLAQPSDWGISIDME